MSSDIPMGATTPQLGPDPVRFTCTNCGYVGATITDKELSQTGCLCACILCLICFPLALIPCCSDDYKDTTHTCPQCNNVIGRYKN